MSLRHIHVRPCNNEKIAIGFLSELMKNIILKKGGSIKEMMFTIACEQRNSNFNVKIRKVYKKDCYTLNIKS